MERTSVPKQTQAQRRGGRGRPSWISHFSVTSRRFLSAAFRRFFFFFFSIFFRRIFHFFLIFSYVIILLSIFQKKILFTLANIYKTILVFFLTFFGRLFVEGLNLHHKNIESNVFEFFFFKSTNGEVPFIVELN